MDPTDAIAVLGTTGEQAVSFAKKHLTSIADVDHFSSFGGGTNPERSEGVGNSGPDNINNLVLLDAKGIYESTPTKKFDKDGNAVGTEKDPVHETTATYLLHGLAHLGGLEGGDHNNGKGFTMKGAYILGNILSGRGFEPGKGYAVGLSSYMNNVQHYRDFFNNSSYSKEYNKSNIALLKSKFYGYAPLHKM